MIDNKDTGWLIFSLILLIFLFTPILCMAYYFIKIRNIKPVFVEEKKEPKETKKRKRRKRK